MRRRIVMITEDHWESVYAAKSAEEVSWYQEHPERSLRFIQASGIPLTAPIIDVGGGSSRLVDLLLRAGYTALTVLDISATALADVKRRLGPRSSEVQWLHADVTHAPLLRHTFELWHDRAVFHFLTSSADRHAYVAAVLHALKPGGHLIVATFADDGPTECSGLPVRRYTAEGLRNEFGDAFIPVREEREEHHTPTGKVQHFVYCHCRVPFA